MFRKLVFKLVLWLLKIIGIGRFTYTNYSNGIVTSSMDFTKPNAIAEWRADYVLSNGKLTSTSSHMYRMFGGEDEFYEYVDERCRVK